VIQNLSSPNECCVVSRAWMTQQFWGNCHTVALIVFHSDHTSCVLSGILFIIHHWFTVPLGYFHSGLTAITHLGSSTINVRYVGTGVHLYHFFSALRKPLNSNIQRSIFSVIWRQYFLPVLCRICMDQHIKHFPLRVVSQFTAHFNANQSHWTNPYCMHIFNPTCKDDPLH
jgi:hypothetical protein